jgi:hypothetical protein
LNIAATGDPAEVEPLLWEFRDALHEHLDQLRAEGDPSAAALANPDPRGRVA